MPSNVAVEQILLASSSNSLVAVLQLLVYAALFDLPDRLNDLTFSTDRG